MKNYCVNCRKELEEGQKFCTGCGTPVQAPVSVNEPVAMANPTLEQQPVQEQVTQQAQVAPQVQTTVQPQTVSQPVNQTSNVNPQKESNVFAIVGFALSLLSILCCGGLSTFGLIFSIIGLVESKKKNGEGKGLSIAGIIISAILTVVLIILTTFLSFAEVLFA